MKSFDYIKNEEVFDIYVFINDIFNYSKSFTEYSIY